MKKRIALLIVLLIVVVYAFGPTPTEPIYSIELPAIPNTSEAVERYVFEKENRKDIKPRNEARIHWAVDSTKQKTEYVLLYLHGYSASRVEGLPVYSDFAKRYGINAFAARLATHGLDTTAQMVKYTPDLLWESAKEALAIAEKLGEKVLIMSTSTGGTLALKLAAEYPDKVYGLINMSPNIRPKDGNAWLLTKPWGLQIAKLIFSDGYRHVTPQDDQYDKYWYIDYRVESLVGMQQLVETSMNTNTFKDVTCPSLTLYYYKDEEHQDDVVDVESILWMNKNLGTPENKKQAVAISEAATHVIGCGLYSGAIKDVEGKAFLFAEEVLNLQPITLAN